MAVPWPSTLPQGFLIARPYRRSGPSNVVRNRTLSGRFKAYRISTKKHREISGVMAFTSSQLAIFEAFYRDDLEDGKNAFQDLTNPFTKANQVWQFIEDPPEENFPSARELYEIELVLLALPDTPT